MVFGTDKEDARGIHIRVTQLTKLAGFRLGYKGVTQSGMATKTAMVPFGEAARDFELGTVALTPQELGTRDSGQWQPVPRGT